MAVEDVSSDDDGKDKSIEKLMRTREWMIEKSTFLGNGI